MKFAMKITVPHTSPTTPPVIYPKLQFLSIHHVLYYHFSFIFIYFDINIYNLCQCIPGMATLTLTRTLTPPPRPPPRNTKCHIYDGIHP